MNTVLPTTHESELILRGKLYKLNEVEKALRDLLDPEILEHFTHEYRIPLDILTEFCARQINPSIEPQYRKEDYDKALMYMGLFALTAPLTLGGLGVKFVAKNGKEYPNTTPLNLNKYAQEIIFTSVAEKLKVPRKNGNAVKVFQLTENARNHVTGEINITLQHFLNPKLNKLRDELDLIPISMRQAALELMRTTDEVIANTSLDTDKKERTHIKKPIKVIV